MSLLKTKKKQKLVDIITVW